MHAKQIAALATLLAATACAAQPDRTARPDKSGQPGTGAGRAGDKAASLDGEWVMVSASHGGTAASGANKMTVTVKGNVVTFGGTGGTGGTGASDKATMKALRLDFGPSGTIRVTAAGADGKFGTGTGTGGTSGTGGDKGGAAGGTGTRPGGADMPGPTSGVYVLTSGYLAISVFTSGGTGGTTGGTGTGGTGTAGSGAMSGPQMSTHMSVVLKRGSGARPEAK